MTQNDDAAATPSQPISFLRSPWAQGALTGALALVPARNYPGLLRAGTIWAPVLAGGLGLGVLAANPVQQADAPTVLKGAAVGAAAGAVASAALAASFWADEQIERGLRRLRVPLPRVVMGVASGAATGWMAAQENERERTQQTSPTPQGR